jgi:hypothetical protein
VTGKPSTVAVPTGEGVYGGGITHPTSALDRAVRAVLIVIALPFGAFMLVNGLVDVATGHYLVGGTGSWGPLVSAVSLNPHQVGGVFLMLALIWLGGLIGLVMRQSWGFPLAVAGGVVTLWYLPVGTAISVLYLLILVWRRRALTVDGVDGG